MGSGARGWGRWRNRVSKLILVYMPLSQEVCDGSKRGKFHKEEKNVNALHFSS